MTACYVNSVGFVLLTFLCLKIFKIKKKSHLGCQRKGIDFSQGSQERLQKEVTAGCWRQGGSWQVELGVGESGKGDVGV